MFSLVIMCVLGSDKFEKDKSKFRSVYTDQYRIPSLIFIECLIRVKFEFCVV